LRRRQRWGN